MARSSIVTKVSLDQWGARLGSHPMLLNGCNAAGAIMFNTRSAPIWYQESWQNHDQVGRVAIAWAIKEAEDAIKRVLGIPVGPEFIVNERHWQPLLYNYEGVDREHLVTKWGMVSSGGVVARTALETGATVTYADDDGDGIKENWSVTVTGVDVTDTSQVLVLFPAAQRLDDNLLSWQIRPVKVTLSGTTLTITGSRWLMVKPSLYTKLNPEAYEGINGADDSNFTSTVDVYRQYTSDTSAYVTFQWIDGTVQTGYLSQIGTNKVIPMVGTYTNGAWVESGLYSDDSANLRYIDISYCAGFTYDSNGDVDLELASKITQLSTGYLPQGFGTSTPAESFFRYYRHDLAAIDGNAGRQLPYNAEEFSNPFGTWRGALEAWRYVKHLKEQYHD